MTPLAQYFRDLRDIYNTGSAVRETSYYSAFEAMANAYGKELKPRVRCVINLQNKGAGIPDAGFFTSEQFQRGENQPREGQKPLRGCAEIKSTKDDVLKIAETEHVAKYIAHYGAVLVTNYRDFLLIGKDANGNAEQLERFSFGDTEADFWRNIPRAVWEYTIGGYQVIKKWLSYRESELLKRALTLAEANEVRDTARRITAILLASAELDRNYLTAKTSNAVTAEAKE
jgi:hypothetical protein